MGERVSTVMAGPRGRLLAGLLVLLLAAVGVGGLVVYGSLADPAPQRVQIGDRDMVLLELTGSPTGARQLVCRGLDVATPESKALGPSLRPRGGVASCVRQVSWYQHALRADLLLIGSYLLSLAGLCLLGALLFQARRAKRAARAAAAAVAIAAALDVAEDWLIHTGLAGLLQGGSGWVWRWAAAAAVTKFTLLVPGLLVAATAALVVLFRALMPSADFRWVRTPAGRQFAPGMLPADPTVLPPSPVLGEDGSLWPARGGALPTPQMLGRPPAEVGICASGGGIRSGTVALAALDQLRRSGILGRARYVVSVSGGGYASGAWRLALQRLAAEPDTEETVVDPAKVYAPGSPELDHTRRHGRYVADSLREWLVALGTILRGLLTSLGLLAGLVTVVGILLGRFYFAVPLLYRVALPLPQKGEQPPAFPHLSAGVTTAMLTLLAVGLVMWLLSVFSLTSPKVSERLGAVARRVFEVAAVVVVLGAAVPAMVWLYVRLAWWIFGEQNLAAGKVVAGGATGTVGLAYLGALVSILWRRREKIGAVGRLLSRDGTAVQRRVPRGIVQVLIVWLVLLLLAVAYGALLTVVMWVSMRASTFDALNFVNRPRGAELRFWPQWYVVVVPVLFVLVAILVDQTWMSLHPFYRRRLATAFAVRRQRRRDGVEYARPYDFVGEATPLRTHAAPVAGHPQVIFAAAANLSGFARTPPGRRATSYTLSHDWVGGPQVGYVHTSVLDEPQIKASLVRDLTVQSAMAVSGAAFASAMGREARAFQTLLALSNARLGTWLPNPAWLSERSGRGSWLQPRIPRIRRLTYLLREVVGSFDPTDRFLLVTDGGHYENLGLVELLRHRCRTVYCLDASGDAPPLTTTLGDAIALAKEELGVTITLDNPLDLVPGSADPLSPKDPLAGLSSRLSSSVVLTGIIEYPEPFRLDGEGQPSATGRLILVKTRLHAGMPADVLTYAERHQTFPYDSTSDQWFDEGQFNAYYQLGAFLGAQAAQTPPAEPPPPAAPAVLAPDRPTGVVRAADRT